jgi:hypothetical protein
MEEFVTTIELARECGVTPFWIRQCIHAHRLKAKMFGGSFVIERTEADRFKRERERLR